MADDIPTSGGWAYSPDPTGRDLRIDFIRGIVMFILIVNHIEAFSYYSLLTWERFGVATGGEGFVILSGFVLGMIYRRRIDKDGWESSISRLVSRSAQLYRVNIFVIVSVAMLNLLPFLDASAVMTYVSHGSGKIYPLYPSVQDPVQIWIAKILMLKIGPHQFQIMGLYVILIFITPFALWLIKHGWTRILLGICWILYFHNWAFPSRPTGAQFEYAFPILTWQLPYFHGLVAGFYRDKIMEAWQKPKFRTLFLGISVPLFLLLFFFTQNNPNPRMPDYAKISVIPPEIFWKIYGDYFRKDMLGIGRLVNYLVILSLGFLLLTRCWKLINKALGWFFIPVGQASLYVFIVHVYLVMLVCNFPFFFKGDMGVTLACTLALGITWLMVRHRILFRWIPR
ncbi:OpgC protein [Desulfonema ishimotonii]|uniref:OpgC protein n=1 Tax=Desulfonema ishimotonii TaxID=45657 RepID=A0A401FUL0_9BACT|nr:OpgC domain-containing protein [Desulfonema ishimotonii]GBC60640.1 OpgC protein [Desulfonema ishimotonii]